MYEPLRLGPHHTLHIQVSCLQLFSNSPDSPGGAIKETATGRNSFRLLMRDSYDSSPTNTLSSALLAFEAQRYLLGITSSGAPRLGAMSSIPIPLGIIGDLNILSGLCKSINRSGTHGGGSSLYLGAISSIGSTMNDVYLATHITLSRNHLLKIFSLSMASSLWSSVNARAICLQYLSALNISLYDILMPS